MIIPLSKGSKTKGSTNIILLSPELTHTALLWQKNQLDPDVIFQYCYWFKSLFICLKPQGHSRWSLKQNRPGLGAAGECLSKESRPRKIFWQSRPSSKCSRFQSLTERKFWVNYHQILGLLNSDNRYLPWNAEWSTVYPRKPLIFRRTVYNGQKMYSEVHS